MPLVVQSTAYLKVPLLHTLSLPCRHGFRFILKPTASVAGWFLPSFYYIHLAWYLMHKILLNCWWISELTEMLSPHECYLASSFLLKLKAAIFQSKMYKTMLKHSTNGHCHLPDKAEWNFKIFPLSNHWAGWLVIHPGIWVKWKWAVINLLWLCRRWLVPILRSHSKMHIFSLYSLSQPPHFRLIEY